MNNAKIKLLLKDTMLIMIGNLLIMLAGVATAFVLPKIIAVEEYGYYKTFSLYATYIGLFSLGMADGVVLKYGSYDYDKLDRGKFRGYYKFFMAINFLFAIIMLLISMLFMKDMYRIIFSLLAFNIPVVNTIGYFQQISQITTRFKEFALRNILKSILTILSIPIVFFFVYSLHGVRGDVVYISCLLIINYVLAIWYIFTYWDISFGKHEEVAILKQEIKSIILLGIPLMFSNLCATLILTMDRQFVSILFDIEEYSKYAFAYNLLALVTVAVSSVSTVVYPTLARIKNNYIYDRFDMIVGIFLTITFTFSLCYFPLAKIVESFLPKYDDSITILRIIFPSISLSSTISIIIHNYYKVLKQTRRYFINTMITLSISIILNFFAFLIFQTTSSISWASVCTVVIWYFISAEALKIGNGRSSRDKLKNIVFIILTNFLFYFTSSFSSLLIGFFVYFLSLLLIILLFYFSSFCKVLELIKAVRSHDDISEND